MDKKHMSFAILLNALMSQSGDFMDEENHAIADRDQYDIQDHIRSEYYFSALDGACGSSGAKTFLHEGVIEGLRSITFCVMVLDSGFTIVGISQCANPENYSYKLGCEYARKDALRKANELTAFVRMQENMEYAERMEDFSYESS